MCIRDSYLYIIDLKNDTLRISQSAVERFMLPDKFMNDATKHLRTLVYEKDRDVYKRQIYGRRGTLTAARLHLHLYRLRQR